MLPLAALFPGIPPNVTALVSYFPGDVLSTATYTSPAGETYTDINGLTQTAGANVPRNAHYIGATRTHLLSTADVFTIPWSATPVPMTVYVRVIDQGFTAAGASADVVLCSVGNGANRFTILATAGGYKLNYRVAGVDHFAVDNTNLGVSGDTLEFRATLSASGAAGLSHTKNGGAESTPGTLTGSTTLGSDTFTRANSTTTLGTADTGGAWTSPTVLAGITNNKGYWVTDRSGGNFATLSVGSTPDTVSVDVAVSNIHYNSAGPAIRYVDTNNYLRITFVNGTGLLESRVAGALNTRGTFTTTLPTTGVASFTASATVLSNVVTCYVNGTSIGTYTLSAGEITAFGSSTLTGVAGNNAGTNGTACTFDNFKATVGTATVALPGAWDSANVEIGSLAGAQQAACAIVGLIIVAGTLTMAKAKAATKRPIPAGVDTTPASLVLTPAVVSTTLASGVTNFNATVYNQAGSVLPTAPVTYTSTAPTIASIDSATGIMTPAGIGRCTITATTTGGVSDTTIVTVGTPSNEPASMITIVDFTGHSQEGWLNSATGLNTTAPSGQAGPWTWVFDPDLQDTVLRLTYGPWTVPSTSTYGPGHGYISVSAALARSIYVRAQMKLSSNWVQSPSNVLKIFEGFTAGERFILGVYGATGNEREMVANDNGGDPNYPGYFLGQPGSGVTPPPTVITKGKWHTYEALLVLNTPGVSDGTSTTWLDGVKQTEVDNVQWEPSSDTSTKWAQFDCNALWGGLGGTLTVAQYLDIGPIHISGTQTKIAPTPGVQSFRADAFVDTIGTNVRFTADPYVSRYNDLIVPAFLDLGLRHARIGTFSSAVSATAQTTAISNTIMLSTQAGATYALTTAPGTTYSDTSAVDTIVSQIDPSMLTLLEGPNEINSGTFYGTTAAAQGTNATTWMTALNSYRTNHVNSAVRALPISTPTVVTSQQIPAVDFSGQAIYGTAHPTPPNATEPGAALATSLAAVASIYGGVGHLPVMATVTGYETNPNATTPAPLIGAGVSQATQSKYLMRLLAEYAKQGVVGTWLTDLIDASADTTNAQAGYGLMTSTGTQKPAYTALKNLIAIMSERTYTQPAFTVGAGDFVTDTFTRANQTEFGTATSGADTAKTWVPSGAGLFKILSNTGQLATAAPATNVVGDSKTAGHEVEVRFSGMKANYSNAVTAFLRYVDPTHNYAVVINGGVAQQIQLVKSTGTSATLATAAKASLTTMTAGAIKVRLIVSGADHLLFVKAWDTAGAEPTAWDLSFVDKGAASALGTGKAAVAIDNNVSGNSIALSTFKSSSASMVAGSMPALAPLTPGRLVYTLSGSTTNVQDYLLQKADGSYWLVLWQRVASWNTSTKTDIANATVSVTVAFNSVTKTVTSYTPSVGTGGTFVATATTATVFVPDELLILKIA